MEHASEVGDCGVAAAPAQERDDAAVARIEQLMRTRDDTTRFVGLALLKAVLDEGGEASETEEIGPEKLQRLWEALPARFLDRLLRATQASPSRPDAAHMRDLAVAVLHAFAVRLSDDAVDEAKMVDRIPMVVSAMSGLGSRNTSITISTSTLALQTLATLVSRRVGAAVFNSRVDNLDPLVQMAPLQPLVLEILLHAWVYGLWDETTAASTITTISAVLPELTAAFRDTDGVTLLDFVARLLRNASALAESRTPSISTFTSTFTSTLPSPDSAWLHPVVCFIRQLATNRPTAVARAAYTHAAAAILCSYPDEAATLLFAPDIDKPADRPFSYLFLSLLLVDMRASLPGLLALLNTPAYGPAASRLASAYDVLSAFVGYLMRTLDDDNDKTSTSLLLPPDSLLRLRTAIAETLSVTAEHLRDRWDAAVAGAPGLHPDARSGFSGLGTPATADSAGPPLAWDAAQADVVVNRDPFVLAALRALALWLREDDSADLRREAAGLADMLLDLYRGSTTGSTLDFRRPVLVALEGITAAAAADDLDQDPVGLLLSHDAWAILSADLLAALQTAALPDAARGIELVRILLPIVEAEEPGSRADWMDLVTHVAAWSGPEDQPPLNDRRDASVRAEFHVAVLQLVTSLVANAHPVVCRRYTLSIAAIVGLATRLRPTLVPALIGPAGRDLLDALDDVLVTLQNVRS
ncbi:hypothetical protein CMQ_3218 [Grosmannia clavigera kw1407]|uniref:Duf1941 family protein n=1 Tax=Grosmannia clavigera (strain kw1407 / UAMH 11150) TaxID=655863 RepID=F0XH06_GROCL|nr:uncharacterized protein CMQ_3218 [Grosmannia clavigera kw1407]EFX03289.1 hypothetical protein CMQ_3218 [Grosmannia clavigera kw1407]